jgi:hypothetical protein
LIRISGIEWHNSSAMVRSRARSLFDIKNVNSSPPV